MVNKERFQLMDRQVAVFEKKGDDWVIDRGSKPFRRCCLHREVTSLT